jgi:RNA polymerase sigma-70 factor (ECF subfamily)
MDQQVIKRFIQGSEAAARKVYDRYIDKVTSLARSRLDEDSIEDFVGDFFALLWHRRQRLASARVVDDYVLKLAKDLLAVYLKKMAREKLDRQHYLDLLPVSSGNNDVETAIHGRELQEQIDKVVDTLPHRQRLIVEMSRKEGLSMKEIAVSLGLALQTVNNHLHRALKSIRKALRQE